MKDLTELREYKPLPRHIASTDSDHGFKNPHFQISAELDPNVCQISPKMLWIHYLVGISHFAKCHETGQGLYEKC